MLKRFTSLCAYLLLVLMPLQALAAANMLVCNSMMQAHANSAQAQAMPCHEQAVSGSEEHDKQQPTSAKAHCASMCANACAMTVVHTKTDASFIETTIQLIDFKSINYHSITLPNLQRPPIFFI